MMSALVELSINKAVWSAVLESENALPAYLWEFEGSCLLAYLP